MDDTEWMNRREKVFLFCLVTLSILLRFVYHYELRGNPLAEHLQLDEQYHDRWARSIAEGNFVGEGVFFRAPLYPYLLGLSYALFGSQPEIPRLAQHLLGGALVVLVYFLSRSLFGKRSAVLASILCSLYSVLVYFEGKLLFDFSVTLLSLLWLTLVVLLADRPSKPRYALFGFLFGMICAMRPPFLAPGIFLSGYVIWKYLKGKTSIARYALPLVIAFLVPIVVVTVRNVLVGEDFVLLASQGGINFYIGNNPKSDGHTSSVPEAGGVAWENRQVEYIAEQSAGHALRASEVSNYWYGRGWEFIRSQPAAFLQLLLKKFYMFWSRLEVANNQSYYWFESASMVLKALPVGFWLVGPLGLAGAILAWREPRAHVLLLFLLSYCLVTIAFFVCDRFRLPVVPLLCIFSGYAISHASVVIVRHQWPSLAKIGTLVTAAAFLVNANPLALRPEVGAGDEEVKAAAVLQAGNFAEAAELFDHVASLDPENFGARVNQGIALWGMGKTGEAAKAFHAGMGQDPYLALINLAHLYFNLQQPESVRVYAERSIAARPFSPGGYIISAKNLFAQRQLVQAHRVLLKGLEACREDFVYGEYLLAGIYLHTGNSSVADSIYRKILTRIAQINQSVKYALQPEDARFGEDLPTLRARSLQGLGRVFAAQERLDSSETYLRTAAHLLPSKADVWADWGVCLLRMNRLEEADAALRKSVGIDGSNPFAWLNFGAVLARLEKFDGARRALTQALTLKPDLEEARRMIKTLETLSREHK